MSKVKCVDLKNKELIKNPEIDLKDIYEIIRSDRPETPIYIRFTEFKRSMNKKIDIYWVFDNMLEQQHNYRLVSKRFIDDNK
jgi:hypothetical protein